MRRFYEHVTVVAEGDGHGVRLDQRPVRTPAKLVMALPTAALADAVAAEWRAQGETLDPRTMMMTGLANAAIDQIAPDPAAFARGIARYGQSDLLCYRADGPKELVARQSAVWDPLLDWARERYDVTFHVTEGIMPVDQPPQSLAALGLAVEALDPFALAGLSTLVSISGSLVCGLAVAEGGWKAGTVWSAAQVDEEWQAEIWGDDAQALALAALREREFLMAASFCAMARG